MLFVKFCVIVVYCSSHTYVMNLIPSCQDCLRSGNYRSQQCASYNKPYNGRRYSKWTIF